MCCIEMRETGVASDRFAFCRSHVFVSTTDVKHLDLAASARFVAAHLAVTIDSLPPDSGEQFEQLGVGRAGA
jgi:hypothetical protein